MDDLDKQITRIVDLYRAAVLAKDVAALMRLYDPAVRVFDAWGVWSYEGAAAWQVAVEGWLMTLNTENVRVTFNDVRMSGGPESAVLSAIVTYAGVSAQDAPLREMQNRLTWVLRTSGHVLRIVHEHTSAPLNFDNSTAILQRKREV